MGGGNVHDNVEDSLDSSSNDVNINDSNNSNIPSCCSLSDAIQEVLNSIEIVQETPGKIVPSNEFQIMIPCTGSFHCGNCENTWYSDALVEIMCSYEHGKGEIQILQECEACSICKNSTSIKPSFSENEAKKVAKCLARKIVQKFNVTNGSSLNISDVKCMAFDSISMDWFVTEHFSVPARARAYEVSPEIPFADAQRIEGSTWENYGPALGGATIGALCGYLAIGARGIFWGASLGASVAEFTHRLLQVSDQKVASRY